MATMMNPMVMEDDKSYKFHANDFIGRRRVEGLEDAYRVGRFLGQGAYGSVYSCVHLETGIERAVKLFQKSEANEKVTREAIHEFQMLKELDHPNLIRIHELLEDETAYYIVTDLCEGGDMLDELARCEDENGDGGYLKEEDAAVVMTNLLSCINYCHQKGLVHRDLKLENILLPPDCDYNNIKLIDFGLAQTFDVPQEEEMITEDGDATTTTTTRRPSFLQLLSMGGKAGPRFTEIVGTPYYVAPEILDQDYGPKVDLWSLGVVAFMLLGGYAPFEGEDDQEILQSVVNCVYDFNDPNWLRVSQDAKDFICSLLINEEDRPSAEQALKHKWLENHRIAKMNQCPSRRASTHASLKRLSSFHSRGSILKQATCAMMASQHENHCSPQDLKDIGLAFQTLDKNRCGKLTKEDLKSSMHDMRTKKKKKSITAEDYSDSGSNNSSATSVTASVTGAGDSFSALMASGNKLETHLDHDEEEEDDEHEEFQVDVDVLFDQVNFSGSGSINYSEFLGCCLMQKNVLEDDVDKLVEVFQTYDRDNKGYITRNDLKEVLSRNSNVSDSTIDKIMCQTDKSGSGRITFDDFADHIVNDPQSPSSSDTDVAATAALEAAEEGEEAKVGVESFGSFEFLTGGSNDSATHHHQQMVVAQQQHHHQNHHRPVQRTMKLPSMPMMVRQLVYGTRPPPPAQRESYKMSVSAKGA